VRAPAHREGLEERLHAGAEAEGGAVGRNAGWRAQRVSSWRAVRRHTGTGTHRSRRSPERARRTGTRPCPRAAWCRMLRWALRRRCRHRAAGEAKGMVCRELRATAAARIACSTRTAVRKHAPRRERGARRARRARARADGSCRRLAFCPGHCQRVTAARARPRRRWDQRRQHAAPESAQLCSRRRAARCGGRSASSVPELGRRCATCILEPVVRPG